MGRFRTGALAFALVLGACGDDDAGGAGAPASTTAPDDDDAGTTTPEPEATTTSEATTATTTFAQADDPPPLVNTGEDFDAIVRSFVAYGEWVSVHPDLGRLDDVFRRDGAAWHDLEPIFSQLIAEGWRSDGGTPGSVQETRVLERPSNDLAIVFVVLESPSFNVVDSYGAVIEQRPESPRTSWAYELRREVGGEWLIENRTVLGEV